MKRVSFSIPSSSSSSSSKRSKPTTSSSPPSSPHQTKQYITEFVEKQVPNVPNNAFDILDNTKAKNINHAEEHKPISWIERLKFRKLEKAHGDEGVEEEFDVSADEFANAYMKRYGWREGKGVGKNAGRDEKGVECKKGNSTRVGLGFVEVYGGER